MDKIEHNELVIADLNTLNVFKFVDADSNGQEELFQAQEYLENQAKSLKALIADCQQPDFRKQWEILSRQSGKPNTGSCRSKIFTLPSAKRCFPIR